MKIPENKPFRFRQNPAATDPLTVATLQLSDDSLLNQRVPRALALMGAELFIYSNCRNPIGGEANSAAKTNLTPMVVCNPAGQGKGGSRVEDILQLV